MCIIFYCETLPAAKSLSNRALKTAWQRNPDGAGIAYRRHPAARVQIIKGLMSFAAFARAWAHVLELEPSTVCAHFRWGTAGGSLPDLTHPFPVKAGALIHNGTLGIEPRSDTESDTSTLAYLGSNWTSRQWREALDLIPEMRNKSRVLVMCHDGTDQRHGQWREGKAPGLWISNSQIPHLIKNPAPASYTYRSWGKGKSYTATTPKPKVTPVDDFPSEAELLEIEEQLNEVQIVKKWGERNA